MPDADAELAVELDRGSHGVLRPSDDPLLLIMVPRAPVTTVIVHRFERRPLRLHVTRAGRPVAGLRLEPTGFVFDF